MPITSLEGNRFYVRLKSDYNSGELDIKDSVRFGRTTGLCGVPYADLLEQASIESSKSLQVKNYFAQVSRCSSVIKTLTRLARIGQKNTKDLKLTAFCIKTTFELIYLKFAT